MKESSVRMQQMWYGVIYDTDKATLVSRKVYSGVGVDTLYRGHSGKFFVVSEYPGERTFFGRVFLGNWPSPPFLYPCDDNKARAMAFNHGVRAGDFAALGLPEPEIA